MRLWSSRSGSAAAVAVALVSLFGADHAAAQIAPTPPLIHFDWGSIFDYASHALVGALAAGAGVLAHRAWSRRRWRRGPAGTVTEAVLAVDLVDSTQLATRYGENLAMRARNLLERRALAAAGSSVTFVENTGDGCMMTFPSVIAATRAAIKLLRGLHDRPPDMAPGPPVEVRAAVTYGEILLDARGVRHGAAINEAFRLMSVAGEAFVAVEGEERLEKIPDRNRVFLDEDAANELRSANVAFRPVGVCRLKGFGGFHRVYELQWTET
ncbi:MAG: hypothetical protein A3I63_11635 [Betaproteobacteria bacterium RIFCSPLOWO2_02_FULL_66_14]|nr:MAG: hypothetical protein A3I63_11635 [Betaproteobacteria bacterium RIFCSPLOWO2_02_FULL_66_14]